MKYNNKLFLWTHHTHRAEAKPMTEGNIWKQLFLFAVPILLSNVFQQLYNAVDSIVVGRYVGYEALAAVGSNNSIINLLVSLFLGMSVGGGIIVSQYFGAGDKENLERAAHSSEVVSIISGLLLMAIGLLVARPLLELLNTPPEVIELSTEYLNIYFLSVPAVVCYNMNSGILRAVGNSTSPFIYLFIGCCINVALDLIFVGPLGLGVAGAAWATFIAQYISAILTVIQLMLTKNSYRISIKKLRFDGAMLKRIFNMGLPAGVQSSMFSIGNFLVQSSLNTFGSVAMAGFVAASKVDNFTYAPVQSFGLAVNTFTGQNIGAKRYDRVKKGTYIALTIAVSTSVIMAAIILPLSKQIMSVFSDEAAVIAGGAEMMMFIIPAYTVFGISEVLSGTLKGTGKTLISATLTFVGILLSRVIWLYAVVNTVHDIRLLYCVYPVSWIIAAVIFITYYAVKKLSGVIGVSPELLKPPAPTEQVQV